MLINISLTSCQDLWVRTCEETVAHWTVVISQFFTWSMLTDEARFVGLIRFISKVH